MINLKGACAIWALLGLSAGHAAPPSPSPYRLESAVVLKGAKPAWDYLTFDPASSLQKHRVCLCRRQ